MRIALCQLNPVMGDIAGNVQRVAQALGDSASCHPDLLVFPELFLQGYPPRDLLQCNWFVEQTMRALDRVCTISRAYPGVGLLVGTALPQKERPGKGLSNAGVLIVDGAVVFAQAKSLLPTYDVFDESRYFDPARSVDSVSFGGERLGISICEDAWGRATPSYERDPVQELVEKGATLLINLSGSPFHLGKQKTRFGIMQDHAKRHGRPFIFVNQVGGNDELVFDGTSLAFDARGRLLAALPPFAEAVDVIDTAGSAVAAAPEHLDSIQSVHDALVLGLRDYARKCGFTGALLGLSGGIDSAVTCALAAEALGADRVLGVTMPSRYSSGGSVDDSRALAEALGIEFIRIPIESAFSALLDTVTPHFGGRAPDLTEENMQARIRGAILMSLSNKRGLLLLSTGNKSEMAVGYCTLYGDMNGGLSVISDLPKCTVYRLAHYINRQRQIIPDASIAKPPSAELRPDQKDQDTLPPYEVLDNILEMLVENGASRHDIVSRGFAADTVDWVMRAVQRSEYKRRQAAPGLKMTPKAFGSGRRFPIAARYTVD